MSIYKITYNICVHLIISYVTESDLGPDSTWNTMVETSDQYDLKKILPGRAQIVLFQIPVSRNKTRFWTPSPEYYWNGFDKYKIIVDAGVIFHQHFQ